MSSCWTTTATRIRFVHIFLLVLEPLTQWSLSFAIVVRSRSNYNYNRQQPHQEPVNDLSQTTTGGAGQGGYPCQEVGCSDNNSRMILQLLRQQQRQMLPRRQQRSLTALNGIRGFRETFASAFPPAVKEISYRNDPCDHLLIDMNQFLHVMMRKAAASANGGIRNSNDDINLKKNMTQEYSSCWDRSLVLLMRELDLIVKFAAPRKSLVLAMDGPPPAAKLATQRKRRQATLNRAESQMRLFQRIIAANNNNNSDDKNTAVSSRRRRNSKRLRAVWTRKQKSWRTSLATLAITPGTEFMDRAAFAILYWVWQRLQARHSPLHKLQIFLSSSQVHGEGEIKLMEWLYRPESQIRCNDYVVMMGGDSDLVLQGLMVPPSITRHVDVLMPIKGGYIQFRISNIVQSLQQQYGLLPRDILGQQQQQDENRMMKVRTDIVLFFILNGNDYVPKLRGSSGFRSLLDVYTKLCRQWHKLGRSHDAYLVDPDTLEFNREFGMEFFAQLVEEQLFISPPILVPGVSTLGDDSGTGGGGMEALHRLNNLKDIGIIPPNTRFEVIVHDTAGSDEPKSNGTFDSTTTTTTTTTPTTTNDRRHLDSTTANESDTTVVWNKNDMMQQQQQQAVTVKLHVGTPDSGEYIVYELNRTLTNPRSKSLRKVYRDLAAMAVQDYLCLDSSELSLDDDMDDDDDDDNDDTNREPDLDDDDDDGDNDGSFRSTLAMSTDPGWGGSGRRPADAWTSLYAYGLLWNLQIYRDGTVSDFGFNYGKRSAPTANEMYNFLSKEQKSVDEFFDTATQAGPISAGLSCVAALPLKVKELIPKPYSLLSDDVIEHLFSSCIDKNDRTFDIRKFSKLSNFYIPWKELREVPDRGRVNPYNNGWTVLRKEEVLVSTHYWKPPEPFLPRLDKLRKDSFIHVDELPCLEHIQSNRRSVRSGLRSDNDTNYRSNMDSQASIFEIDDTPPHNHHGHSGTTFPATTTVLDERIGHSDIAVPTTEIDTNSGAFMAKKLSTNDGVSALQFLNMLADLGLVIHWERDITAAIQSISLVIMEGATEGDIVVKHTRDLPQSKSLLKQLKQEMAAWVLEQMFSCSLPDCSSKYLRTLFLVASGSARVPEGNGEVNKSINVTADGIDAISCLKMLEDADLIESVQWSAFNGCETLTLSLPKQSGRSRQLSYSYEKGHERPLAPSRRAMKHRLASQAMYDIFGPEVFSKTFDTLILLLLRQQQGKVEIGSRSNSSLS